MTSTLTSTLATFATELRFEALPAEVVREAKRFLLDTLACALGGVSQPDVAIAEQVLGEHAGAGPATVIGSGRRVDPLTACLLNALMVRVLDYNDIYWQADPCHPSDILPAAIACGERSGKGGKELLVGIALAYELEQRLSEIGEPGIRERGFHHATLTAIAAPLVAGRMLDLDAGRLAHAVGISASRHVTLGAVTAGGLTMMKNTADPLAVQSGVLAALLAEAGYTGPGHVLDGKEGLMQVLGPGWRRERLTDGLGSDWRIGRCSMKAYPTEALTHTPISCVLSILAEHELAPEQIARVRVRTLARAADILADPSKYDPRSKETADHSLPYVIAAAMVDRRLTPAQLEEHRLFDPRIRAQLSKVEVVADPEIERLFPAAQRAHVTVVTHDGTSYERQLDFPKGDPRNPLSDAEIEDKLRALGEPLLGPGGVARLAEAVWEVEQLPHIHGLTELLQRR
jgi:2-methylcitrate dehydratase